MHCDTAPFDNNDLRLSLKYAINREEMVQKILMGYGSVGNDTPINKVYQLFSEMEQRTYDPDKAAFHYKKSGHDGSVVYTGIWRTTAGIVFRICILSHVTSHHWRSPRVLPFGKDFDWTIGERPDVARFLSVPHFSGFVVARDDRILYEAYASDFGPNRP